ncbi:hypothetical protein BV882_38520 [Streptomyces sp. 46]|nr:hypothetical protein BV882_38520 [Streptomyces sp. 46]
MCAVAPGGGGLSRALRRVRGVGGGLRRPRLAALPEIIWGRARADSSACCDYGHWPVTYLTTAFATVMRMG